MCATLVSPAHYGWKMSSLHTIVTFNMRPNAAFGQKCNTTHPRSKRVDRVLMTPGPFAVGSYGERAVAGANAAISIRFLSAMSSNGVVAAVEGANAATCMRVGQTLQTQLLQAEVKTKATSMDAFLVPQPTDADADAESDATERTGCDDALDEDGDATEHAHGDFSGATTEPPTKKSNEDDPRS